MNAGSSISYVSTKINSLVANFTAPEGRSRLTRYRNVITRGLSVTFVSLSFSLSVRLSQRSRRPALFVRSLHRSTLVCWAPDAALRYKHSFVPVLALGLGFGVSFLVRLPGKHWGGSSTSHFLPCFCISVDALTRFPCGRLSWVTSTRDFFLFLQLSR